MSLRKPWSPMLSLPRLIVISDGFSDPTVELATLELLESDRHFWLHLRDLWGPDKSVDKAAARIVEQISSMSVDVLVSVNSKLELAVALQTGYHASGRGPWIPTARAQLAQGLPIGASVHSPEEARIAEKAGAEYVVFSPVYPSTARGGHPGLGLEMLSRVAESIDIPVFALGGLLPGRVDRCLEAGAYGVGALSGIFDSGDPPAAVDHFWDALNRRR